MAADLDLVRRLCAAEHGLAVVAVPRGDGTVQASVVNAGVLADPEGGQPCIGFVVRGDARKVALLRRSGLATVVFRSGWEWVAVEGAARLVGPDDPSDSVDERQLIVLLRDIFAAAGGTHDDWEAFDRVMVAERRAAILVEPSRLVTN